MKIKGIVFSIIAVLGGYTVAMDAPKKTRKQAVIAKAKKIVRLIKTGDKQKATELNDILDPLPTEIKVMILKEIWESPYPEKKFAGNFLTNYLRVIAGLDPVFFPQGAKKQYLNKFAKKWYLTYGRKLKIPAFFIKKYFPGQTTEQVLDYGLSIQDYLDNPVLKNKIPQITKRPTFGREETRLDLSNMKINDLNGLRNILNIKTVQFLRLGNNQLTTIPTNAFAGLTNLKDLFLRDNQLTTIQPNAFTGLTSLTELALYNNQLTTIQPNAFAGLTNLEKLYLYNNQLTTIKPDTFTGLTSLTELALHNNQLTTIPTNAFVDLTNLETLGLSKNQLTIIQPNAFTGLTKLEYLDLANKKLTTIQAKVFLDLTNLKKLVLGYQLDKKTEDAIREALKGKGVIMVLY